MSEHALICNLYRGTGPTVFAQVKNGVGIDEIISLILGEWRASGASNA
jgi:urease accessory protein